MKCTCCGSEMRDISGEGARLRTWFCPCCQWAECETEEALCEPEEAADETQLADGGADSVDGGHGVSGAADE